MLFRKLARSGVFVHDEDTIRRAIGPANHFKTGRRSQDGVDHEFGAFRSALTQWLHAADSTFEIPGHFGTPVRIDKAWARVDEIDLAIVWLPRQCIEKQIIIVVVIYLTNAMIATL